MSQVEQISFNLRLIQTFAPNTTDEEDIALCQHTIIYCDLVFFEHRNHYENQRKALEVLFAIAQLGSEQLKEAYEKIRKLFASPQGSELTRQYCREQFAQLLHPWLAISTGTKIEIVKLFLFIKYYKGEIATKDLLPETFAGRDEFIDIARGIVASYPTDDEKERQIEFAPIYITERQVPPAQILLENDETGLQTIRIMMIGDNGIGKSCLANQFCRVSEDKRLSEGNCLTVAMTTKTETAEYTLNGRTVQFIDTPGFYNSETTDKERSKVLEFQNLAEYIEYVIGQLSENLPHSADGKKIHLVLFCLHTPRLARWQINVINAVSMFAQVMILKLQCSSEEEKNFVELLKSDLKNDNIKSYHAVLAKDKSINGQTIHAFGMHDLAFAMIQELRTWKQKDQELTNLFNNNRSAYYKQLKGKAWGIIVGFAAACAGAGLTPVPFLDIAMVVPLHVGMFGSIIRLYGMKAPKETLKTMAHGLWTGAATTIPATLLRVAMFGLELLKFVPIINFAGMAGAAAIHGAATVATGASFLEVIHKKAVKGEYFEITVHNENKIVERMKKERSKLEERAKQMVGEGEYEEIL